MLSSYVLSMWTIWSVLDKGFSAMGPCVKIGVESDGPSSCVFLPEERVKWHDIQVVCIRYGGRLPNISDDTMNVNFHTALKKLTDIEEPWINVRLDSTQWSWHSGLSFLLHKSTCDVHGIPIGQMIESICSPACFSQGNKAALPIGSHCFCSKNLTAWAHRLNSSCPEPRKNSYLPNAHWNVNWSELHHPQKPCGILQVGEMDYSLTAGLCDQPLLFLCENAAGHIYYPVNDLKKNFLEAERLCKELGTGLATLVDTSSIPDNLQTGSYWVGLKRFQIRSHTDTQPEFQAFSKIHGVDIGGCAVMSSQTSKPQWYTSNCNNKKRTLCVKDIHDEGQKDQMIKNPELILTKEDDIWLSAPDACSKEGGQVAIPWDEQTDNFIRSMLQELDPFPQFWIGVFVEDHPWKTVFGSRLFWQKGCCNSSGSHHLTDVTYVSPPYCLDRCASLNFQYAYVQRYHCSCSNQLCATVPMDWCNKSCDGHSTCGDNNGYLYSVYEKNALQLSNWENYYFSGNCAALKITSAGRVLSPVVCSNTLKYLCRTGTGNITLHETPQKWLASRRVCQSTGGDLAILQDNSPFLDRLTDGTYWVGISQFSLKSYTGATLLYDNLPDVDDSNVGLCVSVCSQWTAWVTGPCTSKHRVLCFKEGSVTSPSTVSQSVKTTLSNTVTVVKSTIVPTTPQISSQNQTKTEETDDGTDHTITIGVLSASLITVLVVVVYIAYRRFRRSYNNGNMLLTSPHNAFSTVHYDSNAADQEQYPNYKLRT